MFWTFLFSALLSAQSYNDKPEVPVFYINGHNYVRVDCWNKTNHMNSHYLSQSEHPQIFTSTFEVGLNGQMELEVSLLQAENTLTLTKFEEGQEVFVVESYLSEVGYKSFGESLYCAIFEGEIFENVILKSSLPL